MSLASPDTESRNDTSLPWNISVPRVNDVGDSLPGRKQYITHRQAISRLRHQMKSCSRVALYSFNVSPEELRSAHALLDKMPDRRSLRVTYSEDYNFIVKYMPGGAHETAHAYFQASVTASLLRLGGIDFFADLGFTFLGAKTYQLDEEGYKQADTCIVADGSVSPSVVVEVGNSESLAQLHVDARRWLESPYVQVNLVIVISIDPPIAPHLNLPRITIEHWKSFLPLHPPRTPQARQRHARKVWKADWTAAVTPDYYILLADIFGPGQIPAIYGAHTQASFDIRDLTKWRQKIIDEWR